MSDVEPVVEDAIGEPTLSQWAQAMTHIASHYRVACSPGAIQANAPWFEGKSKTLALTQLARQAGLSFHTLDTAKQVLNQWRLPVVAELHDGQIMVIEHFNGEDALDVFIIADEGQRNRLAVAELLPEIHTITALRPLSALKDGRVDRYISRFRPDWIRELVLQDIRPYLPVMIAAFLINVLSLAGIIFSMQVYDRVIPAQSYPTLYVLSTGVLVAVLFGFLLREARTHIMDLLGKRADMRISDRVFSHALRLRNSAVPRSTGSLFLNCASWNRFVR
ncbi:ATP-binding protein of T1SS [Citrobacter youngae]|nr:ATP-binding protein of T1SS [Citrobacter youngae]